MEPHTDYMDSMTIQCSAFIVKVTATLTRINTFSSIRIGVFICNLISAYHVTDTVTEIAWRISKVKVTVTNKRKSVIAHEINIEMTSGFKKSPGCVKNFTSGVWKCSIFSAGIVNLGLSWDSIKKFFTSNFLFYF